MIRNLMTPEAQADAYVWAAVLVAHAAIGVALWMLFGLWAVVVYALFEVVQGAVSRHTLVWDSILDWVGTFFGVLTAQHLWNNNSWAALICTLCIGILAVVGYTLRNK